MISNRASNLERAKRIGDFRTNTTVEAIKKVVATKRNR
jgi:hypothetical protein